MMIILNIPMTVFLWTLIQLMELLLPSKWILTQLMLLLLLINIKKFYEWVASYFTVFFRWHVILLLYVTTHIITYITKLLFVLTAFVIAQAKCYVNGENMSLGMRK